MYGYGFGVALIVLGSLTLLTGMFLYAHWWGFGYSFSFWAVMFALAGLLEGTFGVLRVVENDDIVAMKACYSEAQSSLEDTAASMTAPEEKYFSSTLDRMRARNIELPGLKNAESFCSQISTLSDNASRVAAGDTALFESMTQR